MDLPEVEINGEEPSLIGRRCDGLIIEEYWHAGVMCTPANVIWLQIDSEWRRLFFDCGIVCWRQHDGDGPRAYDMPELDSRVLLVDLGQKLGIAGRIIVGVITRPIDEGTEVEVRWDSGMPLVFRNVDDNTSYYTGT